MNANDAKKMLGLNDDPTPVEVEAALKKFTIAHHPDRFTDLDKKAIAEEFVMQASQARDIILKSQQPHFEIVESKPPDREKIQTQFDEFYRQMDEKRRARRRQMYAEYGLDIDPEPDDAQPSEPQSHLSAYRGPEPQTQYAKPQSHKSQAPDDERTPEEIAQIAKRVRRWLWLIVVLMFLGVIALAAFWSAGYIFWIVIVGFWVARLVNHPFREHPSNP